MKNTNQDRWKQRRKRKGKRIEKKVCSAITAFAVLPLLLTGCQENPDSSIVVNKDMDHLIEQAGNTENGIVNVAEVAKDYETYQTTLKDESLHVSVTVDAKVDIPEVDALSVFRVEQMPVTQELVDRIRTELMGDETIYDGCTLSMNTKAFYEEEIRHLQEELNRLTDTAGNGGYETDENGNIMDDRESERKELQTDMDAYQEMYENAPDSIQYADYPSDGKLHSVQELYDRDTKNEYYAWEYSLNPNGEILYAVTDGNGQYQQELYIQNNERYGNSIRYEKHDSEVHSYGAGLSTVVVDTTNLEIKEQLGSNIYPYNIWRAEDELPSDFGLEYEIETSTPKTEDVSLAPTTITLEEAVSMADAFLDAVGIDEFEYYTGGKYKEMCYFDAENVKYNTYYILQYMRNMDGAFVNFDLVSKHDEGWSGDTYVKKFWPLESIEFRINDDGIVAFNYNAPLTVTDTVVEQAAIKPFEEVKNTFEKMVMVDNASEEGGPDWNIQIDRVILGYARVSEADSYDTGLLVPVWDFKGSMKDRFGMDWEMRYGSILTINAIDGSIIDRSIGY